MILQPPINSKCNYDNKKTDKYIGRTLKLVSLWVLLLVMIELFLWKTR